MITFWIHAIFSAPEANEFHKMDKSFSYYSSAMLPLRVIQTAKWSFKDRYAGEVSGMTKFKLKKKKGKTETKVDAAKERAKLVSQLERYGKILAYPRPKKPIRTEAEMNEAREMVMMRQKKLYEREFESRRREQNYMKLRQLAFEELPTQSLKDAANIPDETPWPADFIKMLAEPPLEDDEIFGEFMTYGVRLAEDL